MNVQHYMQVCVLMGQVHYGQRANTPRILDSAHGGPSRCWCWCVRCTTCRVHSTGTWEEDPILGHSVKYYQGLANGGFMQHNVVVT